MKRAACGWVWLLPLAAFAQITNPAPPSAPLPVHVVSVSRQITVFADDQGLAAALAAYGDKVRSRVLGKLMLREPWRHPILIVVRADTNRPATAASAVASGAYQTPRMLKFQINCQIPPPVEQEQFARELVRVVCFEAANRGVKLGDHTVKLATPPLWFTEGMLQSLMGEVRQLEIELVQRAVQSPQGAALRAILDREEPPPPGLERELFKAQCKILFRALTIVPDGPRRAQRFLLALGPDRDWREPFFEIFGDVVGNAVSSEQWWRAQLHLRSGPSPVNRLDAAETDAQLMKIITLEAIHKNPKTGKEESRIVPLNRLRGYLDEPGTREMVTDRIERLQQLQLVAHHSYLDVIAKHIEAFQHVQMDRFRKLNTTLREANDLLNQTRRRTDAIAKSLDRLEAQQMNRDLLFLYRDYFQTFHEVETIENTRDSSIKDYLDRFQPEK